VSGPTSTADSAPPDTALGDSTSPDGAIPAVSVVVVADDGDGITDCLDTAFSVCRDRTSFEVVLVDGSTSDRIGAVASGYDITVLDGPDERLSTTGAARYVGTQWARGDYLLFADGDVTLADTDWLSDALDALRNDPGLAGVGGDYGERTTQSPTNVDALGRVALYDRDALAEVGGFHPFLAGRTDEDLGFELSLAGYELRRLPAVAAHCRTDDSPAPRHRWRQGYYRAAGQVCSKALARPRLLARWLWALRSGLLATGWLALSVLALLAHPPFAGGWLLVSCLALGLVYYQSGRQTVRRRVLSTVLFTLGFALGFEAIPSRETFPLDTITVQQTGAVQNGRHPTSAIKE